MADYTNEIQEALDSPPKSDISKSEYGSEIQEILGGGKSQLSANLYTASSLNPDAATKQYELAKQTNIPIDVIRTHENDVRQMTEFDSINVDEIQRNFPKVAIQLSNAGLAPAVRDDISSLTYFERAIANAKQAYRLNQAEVNALEASEKQMAFDITGNEKFALSPEELNNLNLLKREKAEQKDYKLGILTGPVKEFVGKLPEYSYGQLPFLIDTAKSSLAGAGAGFAASFGNPVGAAVGAAAGAALHTARLETVGAYDEFKDLRDINGQPIDKQTAAGAAIATGVVNGALELIPFEAAVAPFKKTFGKEAVKQSIKSGLGKELFANIGKVALAEGSTEALQEYSNIIFKEVAKSASDKDFKPFGVDKDKVTPEAVLNYLGSDEVVNRVLESAKGGLGGGAVFGVGSAGVNYAAQQYQRRKDNTAEQEQIAEISTKIKESKIYQRSLDAFKDATSNTLGEQDIYVDANKLQTFFQSKAPEELDKFYQIAPEIKEQLQQALEVGGDVVVPANSILPAIDKNPAFQDITPFLRLTPESLDEQDYQDEFLRGAELDLGIDELQQQERSKVDEVQNNIESQIQNAGFTSDAARQYSQVFRAYYDAQASRLGETKAKQILDDTLAKLTIQAAPKEGLPIQRKIEDLDLLLDKARRKPPKIKATKPLLKFLKEKGGVQIGSNLAGELNAIGLNTKTAPALFKKEGGIGDVDNIPLSEFQDRFLALQLEDVKEENGYVDRQFVLDLLADEVGGRDISQVVDEERESLDRFVEDLERAGIDINLPNEEVKKAIKEYQERQFNQSAKDQTQTEAFKKWFGDSKVVDKEGKPLVVYHGTKEKFSEFKDQGYSETYGKGFYFTEHKQIAQKYAGKKNRPLQVYLSIQKPLKTGGGKGRNINYKIFHDPKKYGYDGVIEYDDGGAMTNIVVFNSSQIKSVENKGTFDPNNPNIYFQFTKNENRGSIQFTPKGESIITLFEKRDLSTLLHEAGHFFLETQKAIATAADAPEQTKKDWEATLNWLGSKDGNLTIEQHEKFARGFEAYLHEGKGPSLELRDIFRRFKVWLLRIYRDIKNLDVKLNDEVRGVFDRMLATNEQIDALKENPLFKVDPKIADFLTEAERKSYYNRNEKANEKAKEALLKKALKQQERESKEFYRIEREKITKEVTDQFNKSSLYRAVHFLKTGKILGEEETDIEPFKLSRKIIKDEFDKEIIKYLPNGILADEGVSPDFAAELFGFSSGDQMLKAMANTPNMKEEINKAVEQELANRYGDMLKDGSLEREALEAAHNETRASEIAFELDAINRRVSGLKSSKEQYKEKASEIIGAKKIDEAIKPSQYYLAEVKAAREAGKALGAKNFEKAAEWKKKELLNHYLYKEAIEARDFTQKNLKKFAKYQHKPSKKQIRIEEEYRQKIVDILQNYNLAPRSQDTERTTAADIKNWENEKAKEADFIEPEISDKTHYRDLTYDEFRGLSDTIENIASQGSHLRSVYLEGQKQDLEEVANKISKEIRSNLPVRETSLETRTKEQNRKYAIEDYFFGIAKARTIIRELDGFKDLGIVHDYLMKPLDIAEPKMVERLRKVSNDYSKIIEKYYGQKGLPKNKIYIESLGTSLTKEAIITAALNWGNQDNRTKLKEGYKWSEGQIYDVLSKLTENDFKFVQETWDFINQFWPEIEALEKRRSGVTPEKVKASSFSITPADSVNSIKLEGGYYPLKYDDRNSLTAKGDINTSLNELVKLSQFSRAQTRRGHTKERVQGVKEPVRLDLAPLFQHLNSVITDLEMGETVENVYKILTKYSVREAIKETKGVSAYRQLDMWLKDLAAGGILGGSAIEGIANGLRAGVAISAMGFKLSTTLVQLTGYAQTIVRLGPKYALKGFLKFLGNGNPAQINDNAAFAFEKSKILKSRSTTFHRDINDALKLLQQKGKIRGAIGKAAFWPIVKMQLMVDIPTWFGAYEKGMDKFEGNENKAVEFADTALIQSQSSGLLKDLSAFERGTTSQSTRLNNWVKLWTVFYSYFNTKINLAYESYKTTNFKKPKDIAAFATDYLLLFWFEAAVGDLLLGRTPDFDDDDEETGKLWYNIKLTLQNMAAGFPILREIAAGAQGFSAAPAGTRGLEEISGTAKSLTSAAVKLSEGEEVDINKIIRDLNSSAGIIFQYPAGEINVVLRAIEQSQKGREMTPIDYLIYKK